MTRNPPSINCPCIIGKNDCRAIPDVMRRIAGTPLTRACGCKRVRICKIRGDRKMCARMAQLGFLPGSEIELVCPGQSRQCMVRIKGTTVTLDELQAQNIFVTPA